MYILKYAEQLKSTQKINEELKTCFFKNDNTICTLFIIFVILSY